MYVKPKNFKEWNNYTKYLETEKRNAMERRTPEIIARISNLQKVEKISEEEAIHRVVEALTPKKDYWMHVACGGTIDIKKRICTRCKTTWSPISIWTDPTNLRLIKVHTEKPETKIYEPVSKIPFFGLYATDIARRLPNWSKPKRWIAVIIFYTILALIVFGIIKLFGGF